MHAYFFALLSKLSDRYDGEYGLEQGEMLRDYIKAFLAGGGICAVVQLLMEKTRLMPGRIMVLLVILGSVMGAFGWYDTFIEFAGAGASVPLPGFGNVLIKGVKKAMEEEGFLGTNEHNDQHRNL